MARHLGFEAQIAALASAQHGVVTRRQLLALGLSAEAVQRRITAGNLHRLHHGVYAVGHPALPRFGRMGAAVLACGDDAALGAAFAADLWALRPTSARRVEVVVPSHNGRRRKDIRVIRAAGLRPDEVTRLHGIPVTTVARTCLDLASRLGDAPLVRVLDQAEMTRVFDLAAFEQVLARHPGHRGRGRLCRALDEHRGAGPGWERTEFERRFRALVRERSLPVPEANAPVCGFTVDFLFPGGLVVELDSRRWHLTPHRFELDRERDRVLAIAGHRVLRFTERQLERDPDGVAAAARAAL